MAFNTAQTLENMVASAAQVLDAEWPRVEDDFAKLIDKHKEQLREVAVSWRHGRINDKELDREIEKLKKQFLQALAPDNKVSQPLLEKAVTAALNTFWDAVMVAL